MSTTSAFVELVIDEETARQATTPDSDRRNRQG